MALGFVSAWLGGGDTADGAPLSARLRWQPSATSGVVGYRVYARPVGGAWGPGIDAGLPAAASDGTLSYDLGNLDTGTSWGVAVSSYLAGSVESPRSNELTLVAAQPTSTTTTTVTTVTTTTAPTVTTTTVPLVTTTTTPPTVTTTTVNPPTTTTSSTLPSSPCAAAIVIPALGGTFTGTTSGQSLQGAPCVVTGSAPERVFRWTPTVSGSTTIATCSSTGTTFDTVLYVRNGTCSGSALACNDDTTGCGITTEATNPHRASRIQMRVVAGQTYFIVVDGYNGAKGNFVLTVTRPYSSLTAGSSGGTLPGATEATCVPPEPCQEATWDETAGCLLTVAPDGSTCELGDPCLVGACEAGTCTPPATVAGVRALDVDRLLLRPAREQMRVIARGTFATETAVDPAVSGVTLELRAPDGSVAYRAVLGGAELHTNRNRTTFRYATRRGQKPPVGAEGLVRLALGVRRGRVAATVTARVPDLVRDAAKTRLTWTLRLGAECAQGLDLACREMPGQIRCLSAGTSP
jgi:hypothetical protein